MSQFLSNNLGCEIFHQNQGIFFKQFWIIHKSFYNFSFYQKMQNPISLNIEFLKERKINKCPEELF